MRHLLLSVIFLLTTSLLSGQTTISGKIVDAETFEELPGASIVEAGTNNGTISKMNGEFELTVGKATGELIITFIGYNMYKKAYNTRISMEMGTIELSQNDVTLGDVVVIGNGVIDLAKDRQTPVAVSTIKAKEITLKSGNQEFPEIMKNTPSVYVASQASGYGESSINIRGFSQENLAVMFNGQPVNGMEDGQVYWSNWQGLSDIASAIQIQRGLGSSKLAISSIGATINIVTKATDRAKGGSASALYGNDNYMKFKIAYSTGMEDRKWGLSMLLSHWQGDGYNYGTEGQGQTYFFSVGYRPNDTHTFNFSITGAPQYHNQNYTKALTEYDRNQDGSISRDESRFNDNWGYKNGKVFTWRKNFYHKPVMNLNWDWIFNEKSSLSTVIYGSYGQGGGTGPYGNFSLYDGTRYDNGLVNFDQIIESNQSLTPNSNGKIYGDFTDDGTRFGSSNFAIRRSSMNMHRWFGLVSNYKQQLTEELTLNVGGDLRTYFGEHFRLVDDMLGLDGFRDENVGALGFQTLYPGGQVYTQEHEATPYMFWTYRNESTDDKLDYYNTERISYQGLFGQLEYSKEQWSAFFQGALSNQTYQRFDYHTYSDPEEQKSDKENFIGYNVKGGGNYNINDNHNVFLNTGYYTRQPFFDDLFLNFSNEVNEDVKNEKIFGVEAGYGLRTNEVRVDFNAYYTHWMDRQIRETGDFDNNGQDDDVALFENVDQIHMGIELEGRYRPIDKLEVGAFFSVGNWEYGGDVQATLYDENRNIIGTGDEILYLDGVKVGDAAQFTAGLVARYDILENLAVDADFRYYDNLYASIDPSSFTEPENLGSLKLPNYALLDMGVTYNVNDFTIRANANNVLNTFYISQSDTNIHTQEGDEVIEGINADNEVLFGYGFTWNISVSYHF